MRKIRLFLCASAALFGCSLSLRGQEIETTQVVDLGLSVKWAGYNIDASAPEQFGGYYAWGEIEEKGDKDYVIANYKWCKGTKDTLTKYCYDEYGLDGFRDDKRVLDPEDDVAHVKWGGSWHIPTQAQWTELYQKAKWKYLTYNGTDVYRITGPSGKSIYLPSGGVKSMLGYLRQGFAGSYYASTLDEISSYGCFGYYFYAGMRRPTIVGLLRECGRTVRAVCD